jgi:Flp pilus assembly protein TadG
VSAIEFALIAPVMILFYLGMAELTLGLMAERKASHAASAIGDLVAQSRSVNEADVNDIFEIASELVGPQAASHLKTCVISIQADEHAVAQIKWTRSLHSPENCPAGGTITVPTNLIAANEGLVMSEVQYVYTSNIADFLPSPITFRERFYLKPRQSKYVKMED